MLLLDEPTEGLMPSMVARIRQAALDLKHDGVTMILVEQRVDAVLPVADRAAFVENGLVSSVLPVAEIVANRALIDRYAGVGA
jgi:branched-chain amino acid transport system ATP-binding protein